MLEYRELTLQTVGKATKIFSVDKKTQRYIQNILRQGTIAWDGRKNALLRARIKVREGSYLNGKPKFKYYWVCEKCGSRNRDESSVEVDHIIEVGPFCGSFDIWIPRLYCGEDNLQVLCLDCHLKKTSGYNASLLFKRKAI